jgi:hypothetical protein
MSTFKQRYRYVMWSKARRSRGHDDKAFSVSLEEAIASGAARSDIGSLLCSHQGRLVTKWVQYLPAYDEQFAPYRHGFPLASGETRPLRLLEIGVAHGGSLQLWRKYFGPDAVIWGVDVNRQCRAIDDPDVVIRIGSQADPNFLMDVVREMGGVDIVLDDGSHLAEHQRASFKVLYPLLTDGGLYVVEDLHTAYWRDYGGGYGRSRSFIEFSKQLIDDMHVWYHSRGRRASVGDGAIAKITFYDSIVFIHKSQISRPVNVQVGTRSY